MQQQRIREEKQKPKRRRRRDDDDQIDVLNERPLIPHRSRNAVELLDRLRAESTLIDCLLRT